MKKKDEINYKYEVFEIYYNKAKRAMEVGNLRVAKQEYLNAAKAMFELAKVSEGELQKARVERAQRIFDLANSIDVNSAQSNDTSNQSSTAPSSNKRGNGKNSAPNEDNTETVWKTSEIPSISLNDVAGLDEVKKSIEMRVLLPIKHPEIYERFNKKSGGGILLYGLPGTGKTMIAKAIAHEAQANFYSVKCSDIVSKWFGEAEQNIKNLFAEARKHDRAIIFFDEFEALAAKRGGNSTVMNRIVPELLAQIQGFGGQENKMLLLLAATNRPWDIDSAMLRPGRFNELIYIPLPDLESRLYMIQMHLGKVPVASDVNFASVAERMEGFSGADVGEFCERVKDEPILRSISNPGVEQLITLEDVEKTLQRVHSSIHKDEIEKLKNFKKNLGMIK